MSENKKSESGITFFTLLGLLFIALKLTNFIDWSWWVVLLPLYGGIAIFAILFIIAVLFL